VTGLFLIIPSAERLTRAYNVADQELDYLPRPRVITLTA
jgi:hypothetical protein